MQGRAGGLAGWRATGLSAAALCAVLTLIAVGACTEDLVAPEDGTCPDYCPPEHVAIVDSVLLDNIASDSLYQGYVRSWEAGNVEAYRDSTTAGESGSRVFYRFPAFSDSLYPSSSDSVMGPVVGTDSFVVSLPITGRNANQTGLELEIHRVPATIDSTAAFTDLDAYFADSTIVAVVPIADTVTASAVSATLDSAAFPTLAADGNVAALGVAVRSARGYVHLGAVPGGSAPTLTRYLLLDSAGTTVARVEGKTAVTSAAAATPPPTVGADERAAGGVPSVRTMLRFDLPARIMDSSTVLRATLLLLPSAPVLGPPGDTLALLAHGLAADFGPKSPLESLTNDSVIARLGFFPVGFNDTLRLDVTTLIRSWVSDSTKPRGLVVRAIPEGGSIAEARFGSLTSGVRRPRLQITFAPPVVLGGR